MDREIKLEGCFNFRDLGGYPAIGGTTRWRKVFRSDALSELTPSDVAYLRDELDLRTVVDLRSDFERRTEEVHPLAGVKVVHTSVINGVSGQIFLDTGLSLAQRYARILEAGGGAVVAALEAVAGAPGACVVHCTAGKDRAGMVSAVLLGLLGVGDSDIVADYALTAPNIARINDRLRSHPDFNDFDKYVPADVLGVEAATMRDMLAELRAAHGTVEAYLKKYGATDTTVDRLRTGLIEVV